MDGATLPTTTQRVQPLWQPRDAAVYLGLHEKTVIKMARLRRLPAVRLGKHWRFRHSDLAAWVDSTVQSTCQPAE
jgi:excisionase family DNA binding protein